MAPKRTDTTTFTLMHKNIPVADLEIVARTGTILDITDIHNISHAPIGTLAQKDSTNKIRTWFSDKTISRNRQNLNQLDFYYDLGFSGPTTLSLKNYGLSLADQYWLKPKDENIQWESINFFQNGFNPDIGDILFQKKKATDEDINLNSPDITTDGWLQKRWVIRDGKRVLLKAGSDLFEQEAYNEEIATKILKKLNIPHTPYWLEFQDNKPYSLCDNFINENTDLVTAWSVLNSKKKPNHESNYQHLIKLCKELGIGDMRLQLEQMIVIDSIIANTDRHWGNFGFIRNADTLEWQGFAPIYDNGTSLWHDKESTSIYVESRAFKRCHRDQLKLINDLSWFEPISESDLSEIITSTLSKHPTMSEERIEMLIKAVSRQMGYVTARKQKLTPKTVAMEISKNPDDPTNEPTVVNQLAPNEKNSK